MKWNGLFRRNTDKELIWKRKVMHTLKFNFSVFSKLQRQIAKKPFKILRCYLNFQSCKWKQSRTFYIPLIWLIRMTSSTALLDNISKSNWMPTKIQFEKSQLWQQPPKLSTQGHLARAGNTHFYKAEVTQHELPNFYLRLNVCSGGEINK